MLIKIKTQYTINDIEDQIANRTATEVKKAGFELGDELEVVVKFFKLWGSIVRITRDGSTTIRTYEFVNGDDLELFNAHYGV